MALAPRPTRQICTLLAVARQTQRRCEMGLAELAAILGSLDLSGAGLSGGVLGATRGAGTGRFCLWLDGVGFRAQLAASFDCRGRAAPLVLWNRRTG